MVAKLIKSAVIVLSVIFMTACGGKTDVVESGTYQGTIKEIEPAKEEIYVSIPGDQTLELYFTDETELLRDTAKADFSALEKGQKVQVTVEKVGKRLDPTTVKILE